MISCGRPFGSTPLTGTIAMPYPWVYRTWEATQVGLGWLLARAISRAESITSVGWPLIT